MILRSTGSAGATVTPPSEPASNLAPRRRSWNLRHGVLQAVEWGPLHGDPVIFLEGLRHNRSMWRHQVAVLQERWRCVLVGLPGQGFSPRRNKRITIDILADDIADLIGFYGEGVGSAAAGQAHVVGFSLGGMAALGLAIRHPNRVRSLSLLGTSASAEPLVAQVRLWPLVLLVKCFGWRCMAPVAARRFHSAGHLAAPHRRKAVCRMIAGSGDAKDISLVKAVLSRRHCTDAELRRIAVPTLIARGGEDRVRHAHESSRMARLIPGARDGVVTLEGSGHGVCAERPQEVAEMLERFLAEVEASA